MTSRHLAALAWMVLVTMLVKVDGVEGLFPFFRVALFAALPFALFHIARISVSPLRLTPRQWLMLIALVWLLLYPFLTMGFGTLDERNLKDAAYTIAIYAVLFWIARTGFRTSEGRFDVRALGWFFVVLALVEAVLALALRAGLTIHLGFGVRFVQQPWLDGRLHGIVGTPSHLAPLLGIACLYLVTIRPTIARSAMLGFLSLCLIMTASRSALLGCAAGVGAYAAVHATTFRMSQRRLLQCGALAAAVAALAFVYHDRAAAILQIAFRIDPPDWEKNRFVMWSARLVELYDRTVVEQFFGAGHRAVSQTFNMNVEFLANYGVLYAVIFTVVYAEVLVRLFTRAAAVGDAETTFLLLAAVFTYVFSQGLNFLLHQFVTPVHLAFTMVMVGYFERAALVPAAEPVRPPPRPFPDPRTDSGLAEGAR